jgi:hypothetical protein
MKKKPNKGEDNGIIRNGQRTPFRKCTEATRNERIEELANYWDRHPLARQGELKRFAKTNFKVGWKMAEIYIGRAKQFRTDRARMPKRETADLCIATLLQIVHAGSNREKIHAVAQLVAISGLEAPRRLEHSGPKGQPIVTKQETDTIPRLTRERALEVLSMAVAERIEGNGNGNGG